MTNWTVTTSESCVMVVIPNIVDRSYARLATLETWKRCESLPLQGPQHLGGGVEDSHRCRSVAAGQRLQRLNS